MIAIPRHDSLATSRGLRKPTDGARRGMGRFGVNVCYSINLLVSNHGPLW
jgi:hypothetical protein